MPLLLLLTNYRSIGAPRLRLVYRLFVLVIQLEGMTIPRMITIAHSIPEQIKLVSEINIPKEIKIDASDLPRKIDVVGIPESIQVIHNIPQEITVKLSEQVERLFKEGLPP